MCVCVLQITPILLLLSVWAASSIAIPLPQYDYNGGYGGYGTGGYGSTGALSYILNNNGRPSTTGYNPYTSYGTNSYYNPYSVYSPYYPYTNSYSTTNGAGTGGWNGLVFG